MTVICRVASAFALGAAVAACAGASGGGAVPDVDLPTLGPPPSDEPAARRAATPAELEIPWARYLVADEHGREITFYVSEPVRDEGVETPSESATLVLYVQGSGCMSVFRRDAESGAVRAGMHGLVRELAGPNRRVVAVEKPGVEFLDRSERPGSARGCSPTFLREHTFRRWAAALAASLRAAVRLPGISAERVLVVGHSEGAQLAARIAADLPELVTHVAVLAGNGVTQLFSLGQAARRPRRADDGWDARQARLDAVHAEAAKIFASPDSIDDFYLGHPYRRWSSFFRASVLDELVRAPAAVLVAHGSADRSSPVESFDVLRAELIRRGRPFTSVRVAGGDHGFRVRGRRETGMRPMLENVLAWSTVGDSERPPAERSR